MPQIPIYRTAKEQEMLATEWAAYEENRFFDIKESIRNRTMNKITYVKLNHWLRKFVWYVKQNKFLSTGAAVG